jgi:hypothetical protein
MTVGIIIERMNKIDEFRSKKRKGKNPWIKKCF